MTVVVGSGVGLNASEASRDQQNFPKWPETEIATVIRL
jgi:hypothetical protein